MRYLLILILMTSTALADPPEKAEKSWKKKAGENVVVWTETQDRTMDLPTLKKWKAANEAQAAMQQAALQETLDKIEDIEAAIKAVE